MAELLPSAMSGETSRLLGLAQRTGPSHASRARAYRELDMLAATGEQASSALPAIAL